MKRFINKTVFGLILIALALIQLPIDSQSNNSLLKTQVNNLPVLSTQLSAQETSLSTNIALGNRQTYFPLLLAPQTDQRINQELDQEIDSLLDTQTDLTLNIQKNKPLVNNQENSLITQKNNLVAVIKEIIPVLDTPVSYNQENTIILVQADNLPSQENDPILNTLLSEDKVVSKWEFVGKIFVDWDVKSTNFSPALGDEITSETSNDTFYIDLSYGKKGFLGLDAELYPSQNLKLKTFITFDTKNIRLNTGFNYDSRQQESNQITGYLQVSGRDGLYGKIFKQKGLKSSHQGGENLFIETREQKNSTRNRESSIIQFAEYSVLDNDYFSGLEVGFARENIKLSIVLELGAEITSAFGGKEYTDSISLVDFYNAATENNNIFTNSTYFGTTPAEMDDAYSKINNILAFANSLDVQNSSNEAITALIANANSLITTAQTASASATSRPTGNIEDIDIYHTEVLRFHRSETIYNLFNDVALDVLGVDIDRYQSHGFNARNNLDTDVINVIDNFLESRTLLTNSVNSITPDFEPFSSSTVSGNVAFQFNHNWKQLSYGLIITKGSYSGINWFGETAILGGGVKLSLGEKFSFFINSFNSNLITNYTDKYVDNTSTKNINIKTENLDSNLDFGIDYSFGSQSGVSLAVGSGEITQKHKSTTGTLEQYEKKNTHSITEVGYKTRFGNIDFNAGIASVVEQGKSSENQNLQNFEGTHNLANGDKLTTTIYKLRFTQNF